MFKSYTNSAGQEVVLEKMSDMYLHNSIGYFSKRVRELQKELDGIYSDKGQFDPEDEDMHRIQASINWMGELLESLYAEEDNRKKK